MNGMSSLLTRRSSARFSFVSAAERTIHHLRRIFARSFGRSPGRQSLRRMGTNPSIATISPFRTWVASAEPGPSVCECSASWMRVRPASTSRLARPGDRIWSVAVSKARGPWPARQASPIRGLEPCIVPRAAGSVSRRGPSWSSCGLSPQRRRRRRFQGVTLAAAGASRRSNPLRSRHSRKFP